ncbi:hypothetical protein MCOR25_010200 [Pyricularia grisea]|uniref:Uncharacterized protein n=1 Tax=Pyricularia grisea TaxID=148305 RepID=A0A6P8B1R8_PYRGI|nr:uncharacterized protein PgNI_07079 [Pyricularia grisea]KAI6351043.1 hypothetical protein MCOR25_010200 [Pyricularia grisea]TLD08759.1 hypothetical protein PgNI_07079 [Pyricularia grisea]
MQYSFVTLFALVAAVSALATPRQERNAFVKRQAASGATQGGIPVNSPAMTNANGEVIAFDAANVYQDSKAKGL